MLRKSEVLASIYEKLERILSPHSFKLNKKKQAFLRKFDGGHHAIYVPLWGHPSQFEFSLSMTVRLDAAEAIIRKFSPAAPGYESMTETVIFQLMPLTNCRTSDFPVSTHEEIEKAFVTISEVIKTKVLPLLDDCSNVVGLERRVNPNKGMSLDSSNPPDNIFSSLALAHLAGNPRFDELVSAATVASKNLLPSQADSIAQL